LLDVVGGLSDPDAKRKYIVSLLHSLPEPNKSTMAFVVDHILRSVRAMYSFVSSPFEALLYTLCRKFENLSQKLIDVRLYRQRNVLFLFGS